MRSPILPNMVVTIPGFVIRSKSAGFLEFGRLENSAPTTSQHSAFRRDRSRLGREAFRAFTEEPGADRIAWAHATMLRFRKQRLAKP